MQALGLEAARDAENEAIQARNQVLERAFVRAWAEFLRV